MLEEGVEAALAPQACTVVGYVERESSAASALVDRMEDKSLDEAPIWDDIKTFPFRFYRNKVDIITAGYPCQPFSCAGRRTGRNDPRHLWPYIHSGIAEVQPRLCFFENVAGHLSLGFREVWEDLGNLGFRVTPGLFTASEVGASHKRERLFILAVAQDTSGLRWRGRDSGCNKGHECTLQTEGLRCGMANTAVSNGRTRTGSQARPRIGDGSGQMENTNGNGCGSRRAECERLRWDPSSDKSNSELGNTTRGCGQSGREQGKLHENIASGNSRLFAPGPGDPGWEIILRQCPEVEPAIRGVADGLARGVGDCLRLTGNGVVPLQAAFAFVTLASHIEE